MKCYRCGGAVDKIVTDLPFKTKSNSTVIICNLPVLQCSSCREYEIEDEAMKYVDAKLFSIDSSAEVEIVRYAV